MLCAGNHRGVRLMSHKAAATEAILCAVLALASPPALRAQSENPFDGDPQAIRVGKAIFENRCAECHGADAKGMNGPDLTVLWARGVRDERVFQTVRDGVSGSIMPSFSVPETELWAVVAYLKSLGTVSPFETGRGDAAHGREIFESGCNRCHRVTGQGGALGPDLTRIGRVRTRDALATAIRDPSATVAAGYRTVSLVTSDGTQIRGAAKGEDAFSIQLLDTRGRLQGYRKEDLRELVHEDGSLMPAFAPGRLSDADLDDVLAYLGSLR
jgi:putative heme-binding domain-containing protein